MSYPVHTKAIICYIEAHIKDAKIDYEELEKRIGFSTAHIRDFFRQNTGYSLAKYVRMRKVKCSAIELINTNKTILEIAYAYGFSNPETYTRAFQKLTGMTPSAFREQKLIVGKEELAAGVYGIGILKEQSVYPKRVLHKDDSAILYGVPKVAYGVYGGNTPYPICLKACSEYLGENVTYHFTMATSAAAFRLVWNKESWDLSNVDIFHALQETNDVYRLGAGALGREFSFLERKKHTTKKEFISFIRKYIDAGYPCIALGVIGPPEPCMITGYRDAGEILLGWNFFQDDPEFAASMETDESGYFISRNWWDNTDTQAVMCMGAVVKEKLTTGQIMENAIAALDGRTDRCYAKGIKAYDAWKKALQEEHGGTAEENYSFLYEKLLCHNDAMNCLTDGRRCAAAFFQEEAKRSPEHCDEYRKIAKKFNRCVKVVEMMRALYGEEADTDGMLKVFTDPDIRKKTCELIECARKADAEALAMMKNMVSKQKPCQ